MALTKKIINKVQEKTKDTGIKPEDMIKILSDVEQGRHTKRALDRILNNTFN